MIIDLGKVYMHNVGDPPGVIRGRKNGITAMNSAGKNRMMKATGIHINVPGDVSVVTSTFLTGLLNDTLIARPELMDSVTITPEFDISLSYAKQVIRRYANWKSISHRRVVYGKNATVIGSIILLSGLAGILLGNCVYSVVSSAAGLSFSASVAAGVASALMIWIPAAFTGAGIIKRGIK